MKQQQQNIVTQWDCINYGGEWVKPDLNFDSTPWSVLTLITIQTTEGWIDVMWSSVDAVGPYLQPIENYNPFMIIYTMILVIVVCMLFMELFVGVVIETFNNQKEIMTGNSSLLRTQRAWVEVQLMTHRSKPMKKILPTGESKVRDYCIYLTDHKNFDNFIMICIMGNTFILGFVWYMQPESFDTPIEIINYFFMLVFTVEAIIKIIAHKTHYFKDAWNKFDFSVVVLTAIILIITWAGVGKDLAIMGTIVRVLRIGRVFRLVKKHEKLRAIFETLI